MVDSSGKLRYSAGDPNLVTFLRSSAKPFQALAVVESGAAEAFGLTQEEIARKYGVSRQLIIRRFKEYSLRPLEPYERNEAQEPTTSDQVSAAGAYLGTAG